VNVPDLRRRVEDLASGREDGSEAEVRDCVAHLLDALEEGRVRAAEPDGDGWKVHPWVKQGILLGFRRGRNASVSVGDVFHFRDRDTFPTRGPTTGPGSVRIVPGGSTVRRGAFLGDGVVIMPPAYVNVGAWVGESTMVDSHALVGSCAQVGARVHLSAAAQIGGVLEPIGAMPVAIEDDVFVGGGCGIYEGTRVGRRAVLAAGVILTRAVPLYDLPNGTVHRAGPDGPLVVPEGAVVVPGARPVGTTFGEERGIHLQTPVIVKYRDRSTDASAALEDALR
jgi:2,3,4,5-tetrahydropyridine-2-carboxylate N-succinyltransferase